MVYNITFIIPHRGRAEFLAQTLQSIFNQNFQPELLNVLIITQDNADKIKHLIPSGKIRVEIVERPSTETISALRNYGVTISNSDFFAFIDADIELAANWVSEMVSAIESHPECMIVSSPQRSSKTPSKVEKIRVAAGYSHGNIFVSALSGHNLFVSRKAFDSVGGFPEHLKTCEDYFFTSVLGQIGKIFITGTTSYVHLGEDKSFSQVFKKEYWRALSNFPSLKNRTVPIREYPSILLPFWFLLSFFLVVSGLIIYSLPIVLVGIFGYISPVILYSFRLKNKSNSDIIFIDVAIFYFLYHTSRTVGSLAGLPQIFKKN